MCTILEKILIFSSHSIQVTVGLPLRHSGYQQIGRDNNTCKRIIISELKPLYTQVYDQNRGKGAILARVIKVLVFVEVSLSLVHTWC